MMVHMDFATKRKNMVNNQLRTNCIFDEKVLRAMEKIPMEAFVSDTKRSITYVDATLHLAESSFILEPLLIARMLQAASLTNMDNVLLIAGGDGYMAALLSQIVHKVLVLDKNKNLASHAMEWFESENITNISFVIGSYEEVLPSYERFRVIFIQGGVQVIPRSLFNYLESNGKLFCVEELIDSSIGHLVLYEKVDNHITRFVIGDAYAPILKEFIKPKVFSLTS